jgi:hypothetical protein
VTRTHLQSLFQLHCLQRLLRTQRYLIPATEKVVHTMSLQRHAYGV